MNRIMETMVAWPLWRADDGPGGRPRQKISGLTNFPTSSERIWKQNSPKAQNCTVQKNMLIIRNAKTNGVKAAVRHFNPLPFFSNSATFARHPLCTKPHDIIPTNQQQGAQKENLNLFWNSQSKFLLYVHYPRVLHTL